MGFASHCRLLALALFALLPALPLAAAEQQAAPPRIEAEMMDGTRFSLADRREGITVISIWSPESLSSRKCIGELERFAAAYASRGVNVIAPSTLGDKKALREFIAKRNVGVPVAVLGAHDLGRLEENRLPVVLVVDSEGRLRAMHTGLYSMRVLEGMVAPLLRP